MHSVEGRHQLEVVGLHLTTSRSCRRQERHPIIPGRTSECLTVQTVANIKVRFIWSLTDTVTTESRASLQ